MNFALNLNRFRQLEKSFSMTGKSSSSRGWLYETGSDWKKHLDGRSITQTKDQKYLTGGLAIGGAVRLPGRGPLDPPARFGDSR